MLWGGKFPNFALNFPSYRVGLMENSISPTTCFSSFPFLTPTNLFPNSLFPQPLATQSSKLGAKLDVTEIDSMTSSEQYISNRVEDSQENDAMTSEQCKDDDDISVN